MDNSTEHPSRLSRRELLKGTLGLTALGALTGCATEPHRTHTRQNADLIRRENQRPGTRDWLLTNTRVDPATKYRCPWIEGFCSQTSVRAGEEISFHVSTN